MLQGLVAFIIVRIFHFDAFAVTNCFVTVSVSYVSVRGLQSNTSSRDVESEFLECKCKCK